MPKSVHYASILWIIAVAAGVGETAIHVAEGLFSGSLTGGAALWQVTVRAIIYGTVTVAIVAMRRGANWARWTLALVLGTVGMLSLLIEPITWLVAGNSVSGLLADADSGLYAITALRVIHVAAVPAALIAMFAPTANRYFRPAAVAMR
ncbi:MAG: hypothetical protein GEV11_04880 [Streptosporangiales bacterium]|nr:hypothetical protein [Streptosporangiales bacterium]